MLNTLRNRLFLILKFKLVTNFLYARKRIYSFVGRDVERENLMVNLGGGLFFRPHWKVLDYASPYYSFAQRFIDYDVDLFTKPRFPFDDDSVACFYSAHTLEHIPQEFCDNVVREIYRCLRPGGVVRLNMPDYDHMRNAVAVGDTTYFGGQIEQGLSLEEAVVEQIATAILDNDERHGIGRDYHEMDPTTFADTYTGMASREVQKEKGGFHINWFNFDKLATMLNDAGFETVYRSHPQGSRFACLRGEGGWMTRGDLFEIKRYLGIDTTHPNKSLYVEAIK